MSHIDVEFGEKESSGESRSSRSRCLVCASF